MEKVSNQRRAEPKHGVENNTRNYVKPKYRVVVFVFGWLKVDEGLCEAAALQVPGEKCENGEHAHDAIVPRGEQSSKYHAKEYVKHL